MSLTAWQAGVLREMGLAPLWRLRSEDVTEAETAPPPVAAPPATADAVAAAAPAALPRTVAAYLPPLQPAADLAADAPPPVVAPRPEDDSARAAQIASLDWAALAEQMPVCQACGLCDTRRQVVPGAGVREAQWMVVGEGPGQQEDEQGLPFVGNSGRLLDKMLAQIGLSRTENLYITNAVKCRPPHNRAPAAEELQACRPWLMRQIALQRPRLILALGRTAVQALLDEPLPINANRLRLFALGDEAGSETSVVLSYHPSYLLRNPADKARAWEDLCFFREQMDRLA